MFWTNLCGRCWDLERRFDSLQSENPQALEAWLKNKTKKPLDALKRIPIIQEHLAAIKLQLETEEGYTEECLAIEEINIVSTAMIALHDLITEDRAEQTQELDACNKKL